MPLDAAALRTALVRAVRDAGLLCRRVQAGIGAADALLKADASPVTIADLASQAVIVRSLAASCPGVPVTGEEDASPLEGPDRAAVRAAVLAHVRTVWPDATESALLRALGGAGHAGGRAGRFFTVDPIDGTKGFLRGEQYAVALALIDEGRVVAGALGCPNLDGPGGGGSHGALVHAVRGEGAFATALDGGADTGVHVSGVADPRGLRLCESVEAGHSDRSVSERLRTALRVEAAPVRLDSQAKYAVLALGGAELYLRVPRDATRAEWIWDHAAGVVVLEEAGGRVTDLDGAALDFSCGRRLERNRGIVATNGALHERVLAVLRDAGPAANGAVP